MVLSWPSLFVSSPAVGHSCRAAAAKWMWAACGASASRPIAAMVTLIVVPRTSTMAVPLASTPLRATGLRFAITSPSAAMAVPAPTNGRSTADPRATVASVFALRMRWSNPGDVRPGLAKWCLMPVVRRAAEPDWCRGEVSSGRVVEHVPVTQSVELVLDEGLDALVRADWDALAAAGLPSQARHRSPSNRPHVTLAARPAIDEALEPAMALALGEFPVAVRLGRAVGVRARPVRAGAGGRARHRAAAPAGRARGRPGARRRPAVHAGGHWVPHVTLAHRMTPEQVALALSLLHGPREADGYAVGARRWDGDARREWVLAGAG